MVPGADCRCLAFANWFGLTILLPVIGGAGLLLLACWWRAAHRRTLALLLIIVALAGWRFLWASDPGDPWNIATWSARMPVTVRGVVATEPEFYGSREEAFLVAIAGVERSDGWHQATGKALVVYPADGYTTVAYGDDVSIQGTAERPGQTPSGQEMSLWLPPGTGARLSRPQITVLDHNGGDPVFAWLFALRGRLATSMTAALPQSAFQTTGTIHLVVTSGLKLSILAALLEALLRPFFSRRGALPSILPGVFVATVLGGAGPAAIRAGILAALLVLAPEVGHRSYRYTALAAAALIMTVLDPFLLWDVGFQLSFLGTPGIALGAIADHPARPYATLYSWCPLPGRRACCHEIAALPVMAASFGMLSIVAPLANLCVLPLVPPLLVLGLMVGSAGLWHRLDLPAATGPPGGRGPDWRHTARRSAHYRRPCPQSRCPLSWCPGPDDCVL